MLILSLSYILSVQNPETEKLSSYECGFEPYEDARHKFSVNFYIVAILFIVFDIEAMEEWQSQSIAVRENVVSTLSIPVPQEIGATIIVCTSHQKGAFNEVSVQAAERFGLLVSQAVRMTRVREDELQTALVRLSSQAERDQTDFMLAAVDALGEGVFVVDAQQKIIVTNERYRQLYGELADMYVQIGRAHV